MAALGTRTLEISVGGTDYTAQVSKSVVTSGEADADFVTFADAAAGGAREYRLELEAVQDLTTGTLWDEVFSNAGSTAAVLVRPYGNATATVLEPHFTGNVTITEPDGDFLGGEADSSTSSRMTFEVSWVFDAKPARVTA